MHFKGKCASCNFICRPKQQSNNYWWFFYHMWVAIQKSIQVIHVGIFMRKEEGKCLFAGAMFSLNNNIIKTVLVSQMGWSLFKWTKFCNIAYNATKIDLLNLELGYYIAANTNITSTISGVHPSRRRIIYSWMGQCYSSNLINYNYTRK